LHRVGIERFDRSVNAPEDLAVISECRAHDARELEVGIGESDVLSGACNTLEPRLAVRIRIERRHACRGRATFGYGFDTGAAVVVRDPHERRASLEHTDATAQLLTCGAADVPVEADARLPHDRFARNVGRA